METEAIFVADVTSFLTPLRITSGPVSPISTSSKFMPNAPVRSKEVARTFVMKVLKERSKKREAVFMRDLLEKRKIQAKWKYEEIKANEEKCRVLFNRLSQAKKGQNEAETACNIDEKLEEAEKRAKNMLAAQVHQNKAPRKEKLEKKNAEMERILEIRKENYEAKVKEANCALAKTCSEKMMKFQLMRERREKRALRSKVKLALAVSAKTLCDKFSKDYQRFEVAFQEATIKKQTTQASFQTDHTIQREDLGEMLSRNLSKKELAMVITFFDNCEAGVILIEYKIGKGRSELLYC